MITDGRAPQRIGQQCARAFAEHVARIPDALSRLTDEATDFWAKGFTATIDLLKKSSP